MSATAKPIGSPFIELRTVESTNNYAMAMVHARMAQHGTCVFAEEQTRGKGQRQKTWVSGKNQNILLSIIVCPEGLSLHRQFYLSMAVSLAVYRFFQHYTGADTGIKWPNDLYWRDRKAGGILIENNIQGAQWSWAVIGIGLNINQTHFEGLSQKAVSLKQITGRHYDPLVLAKELVGWVQQALETLQSDPEQVYLNYLACLYKRDQTLQFRQGSRLFSAKVCGVAPTGELLLQTPAEERFAMGELEWMG